MKISLAFVPFDLWIGAYWNKENRVLYICPFPTIAFRIELGRGNGVKPYPHCRADCRFIRDGECCYRDLHTSTVAVDFDNVLFHHPEWKGHEHYGPPIDGAREALIELQRMGFKIMIWTTRVSLEVVGDACKEHGIPFDYINHNPNQPPDVNPSKPVADYYIDDRAVRFTRWPEVLAEIKGREGTDPYYPAHRKRGDTQP